jgi:cell wall-associated NlpC family hydrolase
MPFTAGPISSPVAPDRVPLMRNRKEVRAVNSGARHGRSRAGSRRRRVLRGTGTTVLAALITALIAALITGLAPGTAAAAPGDAGPGDTAVAEARVQADAVSDRIGRLSAELTAAQAEVASAHAASAIALDTFQATTEELRAAAARVVEATAAASQALAELDGARADLIVFARRSYMDGSTYAGAAALITSGSPAEFIQRAALLEAAGAHRSDVLDTVSDLQEQAARAESRATVIEAEAEALTEQAAEALALATEAETSARQQAAALAVQRVELEAELAAAEEELSALLGAREAAERTRQQRREQERQQQTGPPPPPSDSRDTTGRNPTGQGPDGQGPGGQGPGGQGPGGQGPGGQGPDGQDEQAGPGSPGAAATAIDAARRYLGLSYAWGGGGTSGPGWGWGIDEGVWGFDCSGLTQYAYAQAGITIPRNSRAQFTELPKVATNDVRAGDLVFWATTPDNPQTIYHVAIYLGDGTIIEAPQSGDVVKISPMRWNLYAGAVRPSS